MVRPIAMGQNVSWELRSSAFELKKLFVMFVFNIVELNNAVKLELVTSGTAVCVTGNSGV